MKQKRIVTMPRIFAILVVVAILGVTLGAGSALAARGGITGKPGGGGNGGNGTTATLTVSPNPVPAYTHPAVSGTGFTSGKELLVGIPGDLRFTRVTPDGNGSFSFVYTARSLYPGYTYTMEAWGNGKGQTWELKASISFTVVP